MSDVAINVMTVIIIILFARFGMKMFALYQMYKNEPDQDLDVKDEADLSSLDDASKDENEGYEDIDLKDLD